MKLKIRLKLLIGFTLLLTLSSLVQGLSFLITKQYISSQTSSFQEVQAKKGSSEIKDFFTRLSNNSFGLARVYRKNEKEMAQTAGYVIRNNDYIKKITILSTAGREIAKFDTFGQVSKDLLSYEVLSEPFNSGIAGSTAISKVYYIEQGLGPHIDLFSPIFGDKNDVTGVVKMQINLDQLRIDLGGIRLGGNGYIYIVDNEGRLIAHPSEQFVLQRPNLSSRKIVSNIINNAESTPQDEEYKNEKNIAVVAKAIRIPGYNWIAVFEQPTSEAFGFLTFIRNLFIVTLIGSSLFLLLIALFLSENLTRPIRKLREIARQMRLEQGRVKRTMIIKSGDEIESLSYSFASLVDQLLQREHLLESIGNQLKSANERLKGVDRLKDEFVSLASHELRTPMTIIKSYLWMILEKETLNEKQKTYLSRAYSSTERLINLVNDMLNVSRIESGRFTLAIQPTDIVDLVSVMYQELLPKAQELGINLVFEKPTAAFPKVQADKERVEQVLINLIGNSLKLTPKDGKITIALSQKDGMVETTISDTGKGISQEDMPKLFQKFGMVGNDYLKRQGTQGTGLGLYLSKAIVELMGGKIRVESEGAGKGAKFTFTLKITVDK